MACIYTFPEYKRIHKCLWIRNMVKWIFKDYMMLEILHKDNNSMIQWGRSWTYSELSFHTTDKETGLDSYKTILFWTWKYQLDTEL